MQLEVQTFAEQVRVETLFFEQARPQAPQLAGSVVRSEHCPLHSTALGPHEQVPEMQNWPPVHAFPHAPQFLLSVPNTLVHVPLQFFFPVGHWHDPLTQLVPPVHWTPHFPQLLLSLLVSVHVPEQASWPVGQAQVPELQIAPLAEQAFVQEPQWLASLLVSTHAPPQFVLPPEQFNAQLPLEQTSLLAQAFVQEPQWEGSDFVSTQVPPQSVLPVGHAHALAWQVMPPVQAWPQLPQLFASVAVSTHFALWPLPQSVPLFWQVHLPALHALPPLQTVPQAPQLLLSLWVSTQWPAHCLLLPEQLPASEPPTPAAPPPSTPPLPAVAPVPPSGGARWPVLLPSTALQPVATPRAKTAIHVL